LLGKKKTQAKGKLLTVRVWNRRTLGPFLAGDSREDISPSNYEENRDGKKKN